MTYPYFIDIETVSQYPDFEEVPERTDEIYRKRFEHEFVVKVWTPENPLSPVDFHYQSKAALYAEYGKVCCISLGVVSNNQLRVKTIASRNEMQILTILSSMIDKAPFLCAHNGNEFDFPFLCRRYLTLGLEIPKVLNSMGKKPWEVLNEDTMEMWKFGQYKHSASLDCLANVFGLPSPKKDFDASQIHDLYWYGEQRTIENRMTASLWGADKEELPFDEEDRILKPVKTYCAGDTITLANLYMKIKRQNLFFNGSNIIHV